MAFADFPEQTRAVQLLQRSLQRGRLGHAYLFTGGDMVELERLASTLVKALNCENPPLKTPDGAGADSCDKCNSCRKIDECMHPDIHWVRAESKTRIITIDQVRELLQVVHLKPTQARYKAGIIVGTDRFNVQAANSFLKTLEEPPARSMLILLSTDPSRILETILSRCLRLNFAGEGLHGSAADREWLAQFSSTAALGQSGLLNRYKLLGLFLNQLAAAKEVAEKDVSARSPLNKYDDVDPKLREKWEDELSAATEAEYRSQRSEALKVLQTWFRDVWVSAMQLGKEMLAFPELESATRAVATKVTAEEAMQNLSAIESAQRLLHTNVQEALALEVTFLKLRL
jgi:DNA polymerase-3 subunit delta'